MEYPSLMAVLEPLRDLLGAVTWGDGETVQTSRIGLESGMTHDDYPMVRLVPSRVTRSDLEQSHGISGLRGTEVLVYFGKPITESDTGLEGMYRELFAMEVALIAALPDAGDWVARWMETVTDEDRVPGYKLMALRVMVDG